MWSFFSCQEPSRSPAEFTPIESPSIDSTTLCAEITNDGESDTSHINPNSVVTANHSIFTGYLSDLSSESDSEADNSEDESEDTSSDAETLHQRCQFRVQQPPPLKWC